MALEEWTEEEKSKLIAGFYAGLYTLFRLPRFLFDFTSRNIQDAFNQHASENIDQFLNEIKYMAANKTAVQAQALVKLLTKDGQRVSRSDFVALAAPVDDRFNKAWLETEYNTTLAQSQMIEDWNEFTKPILRYKAVNDPNVRHEHKELDGTTLPKDSPFWETYAPLNGWNCRCYLVELDEAALTDIDSIDTSAINEQVPEAFRNNPAISGTLWKGGDVYSSEVLKSQEEAIETLVNG